MSTDETTVEAAALDQLARFIYEQMNIQPRRMNVAIEMAKQHLTDIKKTLVEVGLRSESGQSGGLITTEE